GWVRSFSSVLTNEARVGFTTDQTGFHRAHPEIPILASGDLTTLPGSPLPYSFESRGRTFELTDNVIWTRGRHVVTLGGGFLVRHLSGYVTAFQDGLYDFADAQHFAADQANQFAISRSRQNPA